MCGRGQVPGDEGVALDLPELAAQGSEDDAGRAAARRVDRWPVGGGRRVRAAAVGAGIREISAERGRAVARKLQEVTVLPARPTTRVTFWCR